MIPPRTQVLIIGGGPAGAAAAQVLADAGISCVVVERQTYPRPKTCGDVLDPAAVHQLAILGVEAHDLPGVRRLDHIRSHHGRRTQMRRWPAAPHGGTEAWAVTRETLDHVLISRAHASGAQILAGHEAVAPLVERGFVRGASVRSTDGELTEISAEYTLVADGANSRFGRSLGTYRNRNWPYATSIRGYWALDPAAPTGESEPSGVDLYLDLRGPDDRPLLGYGWAVPLTDGILNIGLTVVSTSHGFRSLNTSTLLTHLAARVGQDLPLASASPLSPPVSGRIPLGGSVGPSGGPTHLVVGDATGAANAITGAGVEYAIATGRVAGAVMAEACASGDATRLQLYPQAIRDRFGSTQRWGRLATQLCAQPRVLTPVLRHLAGGSVISDRIWAFALNGGERQWPD